jgi:hypothetical protein
MSNFMDGYSTNSQERREAEADARYYAELRFHTENFTEFFYGRGVVHHERGDTARMDERAADAFTTAELGELIRAALRDPAVREKYAAQIDAAAYSYATSAAE